MLSRPRADPSLGRSADGAWVYDAARGRRNLKAVLTAAGANLVDWSITDVADVSGDGKYVIGTAEYLGYAQPNYYARAFVARLP